MAGCGIDIRIVHLADLFRTGHGRTHHPAVKPFGPAHRQARLADHDVFPRRKGERIRLFLAGLCWFVVIALTIMAITTTMRGEESQHLFEAGPAVSSFFGIRPVLLIAITAAALWVDFQALGSDRTGFERSSDREIGRR